ncbi:MAG: glycerophosphodiester phosphodiesterase [Actinomycetes bacterium]
MPPLPRRRTVQVVAHRGASEDVPEHTLAAYRKAVEDGADALECDVRLTSDGVPVCVHDRRVDRTSDGSGLVSTLELADLAALDFGSWKATWDGLEETEAPDRQANRVLTLESLLAYVVDCGRPVQMAIETKHPTRYAGLVERRVVEVLDRFGLGHPRLGEASSVRIMSFSWLGLRRVRELAPSLGTVHLMERVPLRMRDGSLPRGVLATGPSIEIVRAHPAYVGRAHRRGHQVHVWTVDEDADVDLCLALGVDAIITNRPAGVRARLASAGAVRG